MDVSDSDKLQFRYDGLTKLTVDRDGKVGIGTARPGAELDVVGQIRTSIDAHDAEARFGAMPLGSYFDLDDPAGATTISMISGLTGGGSISLYDGDGARRIWLNGDAGVVQTRILHITGGGDLSEQFDINTKDAAAEPGMVVCIDPKSPGKLVVCQHAYDSTVAGVISGAGGVNPGMLMGQRGSVADGAHPVALTGRVYVWADASSGAIEPGDLLTTSSTPGHAMRVKSHQKAHGATLGKAMTPLKEGQGLVLALVSLQ